jgi:predicted nucleic acid-binding protein
VPVVDASLVVEVLLNSPLGVRHAHRVLDQNETIYAPQLLDIEAVQALRRLAFAGLIPADSATRALTILIDLPFVRHGHIPLIGRIWELRTSLSGYDAAYVALAEALDTVLLTCDGKLSRSHGHRARIQLLS